MQNLAKAVLIVVGVALPAAVLAVDGAAVYKQTCAACHGEKGEGKPGLAPALKGNKFLMKSNEAVLTNLIKKGRMGPQKKYKDIPPPMPPQAQLSDAQIKAVIGYSKKTFGK